MDYLDVVKRKRQERADKLEQDFTSTKANSTVKVSSGSIVAALKDEGKKTRGTTHRVRVDNFPDTAKPSDIKEVVKALNNLSQAQPEELKPVVESLRDILKEVSKLPKEVNIPPFPKIPDFPKSTKVDNLNEIKPWLQEVITAIGEIKLDPQITVSPPDVIVQQENVNIDPLIDAIKDLKPSQKIDLGDYKAQDLASEELFQYVGFVSPSGSWYIVENDMEGGSLRYKFGVKNYKSSWKGRVGQNYRLLNEAIDEIST